VRACVYRSSLFKLQIGQGKHWNLYAHSFLHFGIVEAQNRFEARLADGHSPTERLHQGIHNPCLPGGSFKAIRTNIHFNTTTGLETYHYTEDYASKNGFFQALLRNNNNTGDFEECMELVQKLLNLQGNNWCDFSHNNECSFAGVYQPLLPTQQQGVGSFLAFSNYRHVWDFLKLEDQSTLTQLYNATRNACSMNKSEFLLFGNGTVDAIDVQDYCFRSAYVFSLLRYGYGFKMEDNITSVDIVDGKKVGWALGAMLYEINAMPWTYLRSHDHEIVMFEHRPVAEDLLLVVLFALSIIGLGSSMLMFLKLRQSSKRHIYEEVP
jgi:GDA1/CD39 (nucleoside phosphatase) family